MCPIIVYSNYDSGFTLAYFTPWSNLVALDFVWEKVNIFNVAEHIAAFDALI